MRRTALILVMTLVMATLLMMSTGVALASWGWEDSHPTPPTKVGKPVKSSSVQPYFVSSSYC